MLPPIVYIRKESDKAALRWSLQRMREELREPQPGGFLIAQQLAYMILVQALRLHLAEGLRGRVGWLFALADKQMSAAINSMHDDPAHRWTLPKLAKRAGMSRSAFALKFKRTVGETPMEYLTRWRMLLAGDRLVNSSDPISVIALSLGYESESAFSTAFKRVMGCSPGNIAVAGIRLRFHAVKRMPAAPIGSNLSPVDMRIGGAPKRMLHGAAVGSPRRKCSPAAWIMLQADGIRDARVLSARRVLPLPDQLSWPQHRIRGLNIG
jgi:AraC-like DNA-binding protein